MRLVQLRTWGLIALVACLAACQAAPPPTRSAASDNAALAAQALQRGEYAKAADLYRSALAADPENFKFHYGLAVAESYLDRKAEAIREFTWVVERAPADSHEAKTARQWLVSVGALPRSRSALAPESPEPDNTPSKEKETVGYATVEGRVMAEEGPGAIAPMKRMQLLLYDYPNKENYFRMRTDESGHFRFVKVPPGIYKITDRVAGPPTWRLRVELKPGQDLTLDLNPGNSTKVRDDFPEPTQEVGPSTS